MPFDSDWVFMFNFACGGLTRETSGLSSHHLMRTSQKSLRLCLNKGEISSTQHCFCPLQGLDLASASLFANIKILQEPIALGVHGRDVCHGCHQLLAFCSLVRLMRLQFSLCICFTGTLRCQSIGVQCSFRCRIFHQLLVVCLCILLLCGRLGHLFFQILAQQIEHCDHACVLLRLGGVRTPCRRGRWWSSLVLMGGNLCQYRNSSSCDATWSGSSDKIAWIAQALVNPISCRQLPLGRGLVQLWVVEFVQPVLGEGENLFGSRIRCHKGLVLGILILALSSCICHGFIQCTDPRLESCNFLRKSCNRLLGVSNGSFLARDATLKGLLLVI